MSNAILWAIDTPATCARKVVLKMILPPLSTGFSTLKGKHFLHNLQLQERKERGLEMGWIHWIWVFSALPEANWLDLSMSSFGNSGVGLKNWQKWTGMDFFFLFCLPLCIKICCLVFNGHIRLTIFHLIHKTKTEGVCHKNTCQWAEVNILDWSSVGSLKKWHKTLLTLINY